MMSIAMSNLRNHVEHFLLTLFATIKLLVNTPFLFSSPIKIDKPFFCFQLLRKRHIGNDIVTIVFQEPGAHPFTPKVIRSQFQHVFIVVRAISPCTENTRYS